MPGNGARRMPSRLPNSRAITSLQRMPGKNAARSVVPPTSGKRSPAPPNRLKCRVARNRQLGSQLRFRRARLQSLGATRYFVGARPARPIAGGVSTMTQAQRHRAALQLRKVSAVGAAQLSPARQGWVFVVKQGSAVCATQSLPPCRKPRNKRELQSERMGFRRFSVNR